MSLSPDQILRRQREEEERKRRLEEQRRSQAAALRKQQEAQQQKPSAPLRSIAAIENEMAKQQAQMVTPSTPPLPPAFRSIDEIPGVPQVKDQLIEMSKPPVTRKDFASSTVPIANEISNRLRNTSVDPDFSWKWIDPKTPESQKVDRTIPGRTRTLIPGEQPVVSDLHSKQRGITATEEQKKTWAEKEWKEEAPKTEGAKWAYSSGLGAAKGAADFVGGWGNLARVGTKAYLSLYDNILGTNHANDNEIMKAMDQAMDTYFRETAKMEHKDFGGNFDPEALKMSGNQEYLGEVFRAAMPSLMSAAMSMGMREMAATKAATTTTLKEIGTISNFGKTYPTVVTMYKNILNRMGPMSTFGANVFGRTARAVEMEGGDLKQQMQAGAYTALAEMLTELMPFEAAMNVVGGLKKVGMAETAEVGARQFINYSKVYGDITKNWLTGIIAEGLQEAAMSPIEQIIAKYVYDPSVTWKDISNPKEMWEQGKMGIAMGLLMSAFGLPAATVSRMRMHQAIKQQNHNTRLYNSLSEDMKREFRVLEELATVAGTENKTMEIASPDGNKTEVTIERANLKTGEITGKTPDGEDIRFEIKDITDAGKKTFTLRQPIEDYRGAHRAPSPEENAPLHDMSRLYPDDIYSPNAAQYYGHYGGNSPLDIKAAGVIQQYRNNPDKPVTIYRAIPKGVDQVINEGDWVTITEEYARDHGESNLGGEYTIVSKSVPARDLFTEANSIHEFGYYPQGQATDNNAELPRIATTFSGAGTLEAALSDKVGVFAAEYDPKIIEQYNKAHGTDYAPADVTKINPADVAKANPDLFHASPVCKNFSMAKTMRGADDLDRQSAEAVARIINEVKPPMVTVENVPQYAKTALFQHITDTLDNNGYKWEVSIINASDYGGVQNRERMLLRATRDGDLPSLPKKTGPGDWFSAVKDLIPAAPDSTIPPVERQRLDTMIAQGKLDSSKPIITMGGSGFRGTWAASNAGGPSPTLKAAHEKPRIILPDGTVKAVTSRMMARLMGLPDTYQVPEQAPFAKVVLGNGIEGNITKQFIQPMIDNYNRSQVSTPALESENLGVEKTSAPLYNVNKESLKGVEESVDTAEKRYEDRTRSRTERLADYLNERVAKLPGNLEARHGIRPTPRSRNNLRLHIARRGSQIYGVEATTVKFAEQWKNVLGAAYMDGHIFYNEDNTKPPLGTNVHELTHDLETLKPELFQKISQALYENLTPDFKYAFVTYSATEAVCNYMGQLATSEQTRDIFWDYQKGVLSDSEVEELKSYAKVQGSSGNPYSNVRDIVTNHAALDTIFTKAFREYGEEARKREVYFPEDQLAVYEKIFGAMSSEAYELFEKDVDIQLEQSNVFYWQSEHAVEKLQARIPVDQVIGSLTKAHGVKPSEINALGMEQWIKVRKLEVAGTPRKVRIYANGMTYSAPVGYSAWENDTGRYEQNHGLAGVDYKDVEVKPGMLLREEIAEFIKSHKIVLHELDKTTARDLDESEVYDYQVLLAQINEASVYNDYYAETVTDSIGAFISRFLIVNDSSVSRSSTGSHSPDSRAVGRWLRDYIRRDAREEAAERSLDYDRLEDMLDKIEWAPEEAINTVNPIKQKILDAGGHQAVYDSWQEKPLTATTQGGGKAFNVKVRVIGNGIAVQQKIDFSSDPNNIVFVEDEWHVVAHPAGLRINDEAMPFHLAVEYASMLYEDSKRLGKTFEIPLDYRQSVSQKDLDDLAGITRNARNKMMLGDEKPMDALPTMDDVEAVANSYFHSYIDYHPDNREGYDNYEGPTAEEIAAELIENPREFVKNKLMAARDAWLYFIKLQNEAEASHLWEYVREDYEGQQYLDEDAKVEVPFGPDNSSWSMKGGIPDTYGMFIIYAPTLDPGFRGSSSHHTPANTIAHFRHQQFYDENQEKWLFVDETQSDWANEYLDNPGSTADSPWVRKYLELAWKRIIPYAIEQDVVGIAWTRGDQQVKRYSLSQVMDKMVFIENKRYGSDSGPDVNMGVLALYKGNNAYSPSHVIPIKNEKDLSDHMGKDVARRLMESSVDPGNVRTSNPEQLQMGQPISAHIAAANKATVRFGSHTLNTRALDVPIGVRADYTLMPDDMGAVHFLEGTDIDMGGAGLQKIYNKITPNFLNGYIKPYGSKIEKVFFPTMQLPQQSKIKFDVKYTGDSPTAGQLLEIGKKLTDQQAAANDKLQALEADYNALRQDLSEGVPVQDKTIVRNKRRQMEMDINDLRAEIHRIDDSNMLASDLFTWSRGWDEGSLTTQNPTQFSKTLQRAVKDSFSEYIAARNATWAVGVNNASMKKANDLAAKLYKPFTDALTEVLAIEGKKGSMEIVVPESEYVNLGFKMTPDMPTMAPVFESGDTNYKLPGIPDKSATIGDALIKNGSAVIMDGQTVIIRKNDDGTTSAITPDGKAVAVGKGLTVSPAARGEGLTHGQFRRGLRNIGMTMAEAKPAIQTWMDERGVDTLTNKDMLNLYSHLAGYQDQRISKAPPVAVTVREMPTTYGRDNSTGPHGPAQGRNYRVLDPDVQARIDANHGVKTPSFYSKLWDSTKETLHYLSRTHRNLPNKGYYMQLRNDLIHLEKSQGIAGRDTVDSLKKMIAPVQDNRYNYEMFRDKVLFDDLRENYDRYLDYIAENDLNPAEYEYVGWEKYNIGTLENFNRLYAQINADVAATPEVQQALTNRKAYWESLIKEYTDAMKTVGVDVEEAFTRTAYYRNMIMDMTDGMESDMVGYGDFDAGGRQVGDFRRGFLKGRREVGTAREHNTNYLEVEFSVITTMLHDITRAKTFRNLKEMYDHRDVLVNLAEEANKNLEEGQEKYKWQDFIGHKDAVSPAGVKLVPFIPLDKDMFFMVHTIPEKMAIEALQSDLKEFGIAPDQIRTAFAKAKGKTPFMVDENVAKTLHELEKAKSKKLDSYLLWRTAMGTWKQWQLVSPPRWLKYNVRNFSSDVEMPIITNMDTFKHMPAAIKELYDYMFKGIDPTPTLKAWMDRGGLQSGLTGQEMGEINNLKAFKKVVDNDQNFFQKGWESYWGSARLTNDFRESWLRYASFKSYLQQMAGDLDASMLDAEGNISLAHLDKAKPDNFGASLRDEIMGLRNIYDRSYWLSNELCGGYDRISEFGKMMRTYVYPFWSWQEVNLKRYFRLVNNALEDGEFVSRVGRAVMSKFGKSSIDTGAPAGGNGVIMRGALTAYKLGRIWLGGSILGIISSIWNYAKFPDHEEALSEDELKGVYLVVGRKKDGSYIYFNRLGYKESLQDWIGGSPYHYRRDLATGRKTLGDVAKEVMNGPRNLIMSGLGPHITMPYEGTTGMALWPDPENPKNITDRMRHNFQNLGLTYIYDKFAGNPTHTFGEEMTRLIAYVAKEGQGSYYSNRDEINRFLKDIGKEKPDVMVRGDMGDKSQAAYDMRLAIRLGSKESFEKAALEYVLSGGSYFDFERTLAGLHPLANIPEEFRDQYVNEWLDDAGRKKLAAAEKFYEEVLLGDEYMESLKDINFQRMSKDEQEEFLGKLRNRKILSELTDTYDNRSGNWRNVAEGILTPIGRDAKDIERSEFYDRLATALESNNKKDIDDALWLLDKLGAEDGHISSAMTTRNIVNEQYGFYPPYSSEIADIISEGGSGYETQFQKQLAEYVATGKKASGIRSSTLYPLARDATKFNDRELFERTMWALMQTASQEDMKNGPEAFQRTILITLAENKNTVLKPEWGLAYYVPDYDELWTGDLSDNENLVRMMYGLIWAGKKRNNVAKAGTDRGIPGSQVANIMRIYDAVQAKKVPYPGQ